MLKMCRLIYFIWMKKTPDVSFLIIKTEATDSWWTRVGLCSWIPNTLHLLKFTVSVLQNSDLHWPSLAFPYSQLTQTASQILAVSQELHPESLRYRLVNTRNPNKYLWGSNIKWTFWRLTFLFPMNNASQRTKVRLFSRRVNVWRYLVWHHVLPYTSNLS